jgi:ketosteroid isomerase-like protein
MSEESTTPDPVELTRRTFEAGSRHDVEAALGFYAPDAVMDLSDAALGYFEGVAAIAGFLQDWWGTWGEHLIEVEESTDLGHGVVFSRVREDGRLAGSDSHEKEASGAPSRVRPCDTLAFRPRAIASAAHRETPASVWQAIVAHARRLATARSDR